MKRYRSAAVLIVSALLAAQLPVAAQDDTREKINQLIVYGDDPCPASNDGSITVCARKDEAERFRIPAPLREIPMPQSIRAGPSGSRLTRRRVPSGSIPARQWARAG